MVASLVVADWAPSGSRPVRPGSGGAGRYRAPARERNPRGRPAAALEIFRGRTWRTGIDGKLAIVRDACTMLNAESQARRAEMLELIIVLLIVFEIVMAFWRR